MLLGISIIVYSLLTRYELSVAKLIPMPVHLGIDAPGGILLIASPWLFGFRIGPHGPCVPGMADSRAATCPS